MYYILSNFIELSAAALILVPVFAVLHFRRFHLASRTAFCCLFALYVACLYFVTGLPTVLHLQFDPNLYLIPFIGMLDDRLNSVLNTILFLPLGFLLPKASGKFSQLRFVLSAGFCVSLFIELMQLLNFRLTDVNDLITNTIGAVLGYLVFRLLKINRSPKAEPGDLTLIFIVTLAVMFFLQPLLVNFIWYLIP